MSRLRPCTFWRWTRPGANLDDPEASKLLFCDKKHTEHSNSPRYPCKHRRCELLDRSTTTDKLGPESDLGYLTGDRNCYRQKFGQFEGCFKPDVSYHGALQAGAPIDNIKSWGECAKICKAEKSTCKFWTWASSTCTNCRPESCTRYATIIEEFPNKYGFISGEVECQDIVYIETDQDKIVDGLTEEASSGAGKCLVRKRSTDEDPEMFGRPKCAAQEVPGYRFYIANFPLTISFCAGGLSVGRLPMSGRTYFCFIYAEPFAST